MKKSVLINIAAIDKSLFFKFYLMMSFCCFAGSIHSEPLLPLTTWISSHKNLSVDDTAYLGARCGVLYNINQKILADFIEDSALTKMQVKSMVYFSVSTHSSVLSWKNSNTNLTSDLREKHMSFVNRLYESYYSALKNNQPIPFSLSTELLATDLGVCDSTNETFSDVYKILGKKKGLQKN